MSSLQGKYIEVEAGVELFVRDAGEGEVLVFVPGWTFTGEVFEKQIDYFKTTNRVIVVDPRSQGRSTVTLHGNNYTTHGTDLKKVLDSLEISDFTLIGWSFGYLTVLEYVRQYGLEGVRAVVDIDLSPKPLSNNHETDWVEGPLDDIAATYTQFMQSASFQREFVSIYVNEVMVQREVQPEELDWFIAQSLNTPTAIAANLFASGMFANYLDEAKLIADKIPSYAVVAEHWSDVAIAFLQQITPQTQTRALGGHAMFWEHAEQFNQILEAWLKNIKQTA